MSENTSAAGGFIHPSPVPGQEAIEDVLHDCIAGVTRLCGNLVRPRWQEEAPRVPKAGVSWCAFGITNYDPLNFPVAEHSGEGEGHDILTDHENLTVLISFYGPGPVDQARQLRRSLHISQNRKILRKNGLAFVKAGAIVPVPEQVALQWRARVDITLTFQLVTSQIYAALNLKQMSGTLVSEQPQDGSRPGASAPFGCQACSRACWR
ncbi:conserved hypothetical protein [uncultured delta proteobacterium]|uniref:Phage neck terminator protein gp12-like domain-containing protein n=1 Tax=uncultured delta proteobacterium TaxID=34034 RepID=A0A212J7V0_9DELT|nr:conserved hypothetical protein [uncultured delta proteobacterium]